jgi:hypothetical protein
VLSKSKDISLLIEIHKLGDEKTLYQPIMNLLIIILKKNLIYYKVEKDISLSADGNYNLRYI